MLLQYADWIGRLVHSTNMHITALPSAQYDFVNFERNEYITNARTSVYRKIEFGKRFGAKMGLLAGDCLRFETAANRTGPSADEM